MQLNHTEEQLGKQSAQDKYDRRTRTTSSGGPSVARCEDTETLRLKRSLNHPSQMVLEEATVGVFITVQRLKVNNQR